MPRFKITETRARESIYIIDAADERAARNGEGDIVYEAGDADDYTLSVDSVEQVADDYEGD